MKLQKKIRSFLSGILAMCLVVGISLPALAVNNGIKEGLTPYERAVIQRNMEIRNIWGEDFVAEQIYDSNSKPRFALGVTHEGYIILERNSKFTFHEGGEGNPYELFMNEKKYYGGPMCYYIEPGGRSGTFYNIATESYEPNIRESSFITPPEASLNLDTTGLMSVTEDGETRVANCYQYIRKKAFGYNGGTYNNTCSAVAAGIALNYLALQKNSSIVPASMRSEAYGVLPSSNTIQSYYPKAHALHVYLVDVCGMHAASFGTDIAVPINTYGINQCPYVFLNMSVSYTAMTNASINKIKKNINNDMPVLITTTFTSNSDYNWHTMCVYGYRTTNSSTEYLVHNGWHGNTYSKANSNGTIRAQNEVWVSSNYASLANYFSIG